MEGGREVGGKGRGRVAGRRGGWFYILGRVPEVRLERETGNL